MFQAERIRHRSAPASHGGRRRLSLGVHPLEDRTVPDGAGTPVPDIQPVAVGDTVWRDVNANGRQDPGEPGIPGLIVQIFEGSTLRGTSITDADGHYHFDASNVFNDLADGTDDGLKPATNYEIRILNDQGPINGLRPTWAHATADATTDSEAMPGPLYSSFSFNSGTDGADQNRDIGFAPAASIGNMIWSDANNNGRRDAGEAGLGGVVVRLLSADGTVEIARTTTASDGSYLFSNQVAGTYVVELAASNFATGGPLAGYSSSTGNPGQAGPAPYEGDLVPNPNTDRSANDDNGMAVGGAIRSRPVQLVEADANNRTVGFGVYAAASLTGRVYVDKNGNGQMDANEVEGVAKVRIRIAGPVTVLTQTDAMGNYSFTNLPAGSYTVIEVNQPVGYGSSTPNATTATLAAGSTAVVRFGETQQVDLRVSQTVNRRTAKVGDVVIITYKVKNVGSLPATDVLVKAPLKGGLKYMSAEVTGSATYSAASGNGAVGDLLPGQEAVFRLRAKVTKTGLLAAGASAQAEEADGEAKNNTARITVSVPPPPPPTAPDTTRSPGFWLSLWWWTRR